MLLHPEVVNMARRKYTGRSEEAVSTVVSAILLLALVVALITSINVRYVPQWTEDAEHLHMRTVTNDMAHLKSGVDLMLTASATGSNSFSAGIPITMGGGEVPFFSSLSSSSTLMLNSRTVNMYMITELGGVNQNTGDLMKDMGSVDFLSNNNQYANQRFSYECGGLVLGQDNRSIMKMVPHISVTKSLNDTIDVTFDAVKLGGLQRTVLAQGQQAGQLRLTYRKLPAQLFVKHFISLHEPSQIPHYPSNRILNGFVHEFVLELIVGPRVQ